MNLLGLVIPPRVRPALAAVALVGAFSAGWTVNGWRHDAHEARALKQAQAAFQKQLDKQQAESANYEQDREQGRQQNVTRQEQIRTVFRDRPVPGTCAVPDSVRGVLKSAVDAANKRAAGQSVAAVPPAP